MSTIQAFSSVSVVDLTDVGVINFYLTSNQPNSVVYDPNGNSYTPNWSSSNLEITPVISYNGTSVAPNAQEVNITYRRKEGSGIPTSLTTGETVSNGVLTVSANKLETLSSNSKQLTYICDIQYTDSASGVPISSQASLTYSLVTMASEVKTVNITGESVFLYNTNRQIVGSGNIVLTANLSPHCSVSQWQYQDAQGHFVLYPGSGTSNTLTVSHLQDNIWIKDGKVAIIKVQTNANGVFDIAQITKVYDGAAGDAVIAAVLTNENHVLPVNSDGTPKGNNWGTIAATKVYIYEGGEDVTSTWNISVSTYPANDFSGSYNPSTYEFTPGRISTTCDSAYAEFTCTKNGYSDIKKRYTITKQYAGIDGQDAVIYEISPNTYSINKDISGNFSPPSITFTAYRTIGNKGKTNYSGRFSISESSDGTNYGNPTTSEGDEFFKTYTPSSSAKIIRCVLYEAGGFTTQLDSQSVVVTSNGDPGQPGADGLSLGLGNYSDVIPCNASGATLVQRQITIPYYAYKGISRVAVSASVNTTLLPSGMTVNTNLSHNGTTGQDGQLVLNIASGATLSNLSTGDITITLTATESGTTLGTLEQKYTWTKSIQSKDAVLLQLFSPDGGNVREGVSTTINAIVYSGTSDVTSSSSFVWKKFDGGPYNVIPGKTGSSITIGPNDVTDQMWLKCEATYPSGSGGNTYSSYYTIDDTTDPLTAYSYATISEFKNRQGFGAIYTRVYRNGVEVDPIKSTTFSSTAPSSPSNGDFYYQLTKTRNGEGTCVLMRYNGSNWVDATETDKDTYVYSYYRIDNAGNAMDTTEAWATGRAQYIDPFIVDGRMQFICEVSKASS